MGFWKKLVSPEEKNEEKFFQERSPRVRLLFSDECFVEILGQTFSLHNLSETGFGFYQEKKPLPHERVVEALLSMGEERIRFNVEIVRVQSDFVGAKFLGDNSTIRGFLRRTFHEELEATKMQEVDSSKMKESEGNPRWFYAPGNYELYYLEKNGNIFRGELGMGTKLFVAHPPQALRYGFLKEEDREQPMHARSALVQWQEPIPLEVRNRVFRVLENISGLNEGEKAKLKALFGAY